MRAGHRQIQGVITTAVLAVLIALVGLGGAIRLAQSAAELGPQVGDILTFEPDRHLPYDVPPQVEAERANLPTCTLDVGLIHRLGGSLIIEARSPLPNRTYRVHWAGQHSSQGARDCGGSAELQVTQEHLDVLAMAAGGYGVSQRKLAASSLWRSGGSAGPSP